MARNLILLSSVLIVLVVEINVTLSQFINPDVMNGNLFGGVKDTLSGFSSVIGGSKGLPHDLDKKARKGLETVGLGKAADMVGFRSEEKEEDEELEGAEQPNENENEETEEEFFEEEKREEEENSEEEDIEEDEEEEEEEDYMNEKENEGRKSRKGDKKGSLSSFTDRVGEMDDKISDTFGMRTGVGRFTELIGGNGYEDENEAKNRKQSKSSHKGSRTESSAISETETSDSSKASKGKSAKGKADKWPTPSPPFFG